MSTSLRVVLNRAAAEVLKDDTRVLLEVDTNGLLKLKPSRRDDPNAISAKVSVSTVNGLATFRLTKGALKRLARRGANLVAGTKFAVSVAPYRWLSDAVPLTANDVATGPTVTITKG